MAPGAGCPEVPQYVGALERAQVVRSARADAKRALRSGTLKLTDAMSDPPAELSGALLIEIVRWTYSANAWRGPSVQELGRAALRDRINLMMPLGLASVRSRAWLAEHGQQHWRPRP